MMPAKYFALDGPRFEGTVLMVTGGASGIGRRTAERFAEAGASVIACDIAAMGAASHSNVTHMQLDVTQEAAWETAVAATLAQFGRIDALVNCAGIVLMGNVVDLALEGFQRLMAINVEGTFLGMKHVMRVMLPRGGGSIVNISSIMGINGSPGASAYCASKGAVRLLTKAAALEAIAAGTSVRVNSIHPTLTDTPLIDRVTEQVGGGAEVREQLRATLPGGRLASADQIVDGIMFLISPQSAFCNGSELLVDNGYTAQ